MQTPWGDFPVSDAHTHFFSRRFFASLAAQMSADSDIVAGTLGWRFPRASSSAAQVRAR